MDKRIVGVKICRRAPSINHLFFADDSLIIMKAENKSATELGRLLHIYEQASGQMINMEKSSILFSLNTSTEVRDQIKQSLSISQETVQERYLGLPISIGKARKKTFSYIKQKIWARVQGWQEKILSKAGKEILIKAVAQAIPTYAMSCFDITKGLCDELSSMIGRYWWSQQDNTHKIHWISWEKLTRSKKKGGLGFKDLHLFNKAMLAHQAWRLLTCPDTLCAKVFKAKYYPNSSLLHCRIRGRISYTWSSIVSGIKLLREGIIWRVGNGASIDIWQDPWLPRGTTRKPVTSRGQSLLTRVEELINPILGEWDEQLVRDTFWQQDADVILNLPISEGESDWMAWHYDKAGKFSVKSAYKLAAQSRDKQHGTDASTSNATVASASTMEWHKIWQL